PISGQPRGRPPLRRGRSAGPAVGVGRMKKALRQFLRHRGAVIGTLLVLGFIGVALIAPVIAPHDPLAQSLGDRLQPPSSAHLFGTDDFGRDVFSRVLWGSRVSLRLGLVAVAIALVFGGMIGLLAGY